jgi:hypothetical protein
VERETAPVRERLMSELKMRKDDRVYTNCVNTLKTIKPMKTSNCGSHPRSNKVIA